MIRTARLSDDNTLRFDLVRLDETLPYKGRVLFALANPSTADAEIDDPTVKKCWSYTAKWGYSHMVIVNTNPYRSTDPKSVQHPGYFAMKINQLVVREHARQASVIVCAWGQVADSVLAFHARLDLMKGAGGQGSLSYLELCNDGTPKHPLYLKGDLKPTPWVTE